MVVGIGLIVVRGCFTGDLQSFGFTCIIWHISKVGLQAIAVNCLFILYCILYITKLINHISEFIVLKYSFKVIRERESTII
jgi:hypothetical protein